jgi:hypothetical protein
MAIKFTDLKGKASKAGLPRMKFVPGINKFRIISDVMPGYKYWLTTAEGSSVPMDCLSFDREKEEFTNVEKDWVREYFPDKKCSWAYSCFVIDRSDNTVKLLDLKKKLLQQIITAAKKIGDPSDRETGWDVICDRESTGPQVFNVEYTLQVFDLDPNTPLSEEDLELIKDLPNIEEYLVRATPSEQKQFIEERILGENDDDVDEEALEEISDDIPM